MDERTHKVLATSSFRLGVNQIISQNQILVIAYLNPVPDWHAKVILAPAEYFLTLSRTIVINRGDNMDLIFLA